MLEYIDRIRSRGYKISKVLRKIVFCSKTYALLIKACGSVYNQKYMLPLPDLPTFVSDIIFFSVNKYLFSAIFILKIILNIYLLKQ